MTAFIGQPVKQGNLFIVGGDDVAFNFHPPLCQFGFFAEIDLFMGVGQNTVRIDIFQKFREKTDKFFLLVRIEFFPFPPEGALGQFLIIEYFIDDLTDYIQFAFSIHGFIFRGLHLGQHLVDLRFNGVFRACGKNRHRQDH